MHHDTNFWLWTTSIATLAVAFAAAGLLIELAFPPAPAWVGTLLLGASLAATASAFGRLALRLRHLELENEGLVEELSQEFIRVRDKLDIFSEALDAPRSVTPEEADAEPARRIVVK